MKTRSAAKFPAAIPVVREVERECSVWSTENIAIGDANRGLLRFLEPIAYSRTGNNCSPSGPASVANMAARRTWQARGVERAGGQEEASRRASRPDRRRCGSFLPWYSSQRTSLKWHELPSYRCVSGRGRWSKSCRVCPSRLLTRCTASVMDEAMT
jgi:hypothetical protein